MSTGGADQTGTSTATGSWPLRNVLDPGSGEMAPHHGTVVQHLSAMAHAYSDAPAVAAVLATGDPVIYRAFDADVPEAAHHLAYRTTVVLPGTVGREYFMTRGHHHVIESAELYLGMAGTGLMVMQARDGRLRVEQISASVSVYVPPGWAHRTVNTGGAELVFLAVYPADAGHDYGSVERDGFAARVFAGKNGPEVVQGPPRS